MTKAQRPSLVKFVIGAIFTGEGVLVQVRESLSRNFGHTDFESEPIPFDSTDYYGQEMGHGLLKQFFSFRRLIDPEELAAIKLYTNRLEDRFSTKGKRRINLDPGYITAAKLVLATCKNYAHRVYLAGGVFAEVTLHFQEGEFQPQPWTYPDYKTEKYLQSFKAIRDLYLQQLPE